MMSDSVSINVFVIAYCAFWLILFGICFGLAMRRSRQDADYDAALRASAVPQEGVWPPPPTTHIRVVTDAWVWCSRCHRVSLESHWLQVGCPYADCDGELGEELDWKWLLPFVPSFPDEPIPGTVYSDNTVQSGPPPWWKRGAHGKRRST